MAMEVNDLVQIVDKQVYVGEECLNVFYYKCATVGTDPDLSLEDLLDWFRLTLLGAVTDIQAVSLQHLAREARNLSNGVDFFVDTEVVTGQLSLDTTDQVNSFTSMGFVLQRSDLNTRNGYKRFAGLTEAQIEGNSYVGSMTPVHAVEDVLHQVVNTLNGDTFTPVIVKRPIPDPGTTDAIVSVISDATFRGIGTQNSRKP